MASTKSPLSLSGKSMRTPSPKKNFYKTKAYTSDVDETLFGAPSRFVQQKETRHLYEEKEWDPPWVTSPRKTGAPLLWTPFTSQDQQDYDTMNAGNTRHARSKSATPRSARHSSKYRLKGQSHSYIDETLFGSKHKESSFNVPRDSNERSDGLKNFFLSSRGNEIVSPRSDDSLGDRPGSRLGSYNDPYIPPTPRDGPSVDDLSTPVIKRRSGSNIKTDGFRSRAKNVEDLSMKLDFDEQSRAEKDELIERALRLARQAQEAAVKSSTRKQAWSRPGSTPGSSPRMSGSKSPRFSDFVDIDNLSATGVRVPLSARESDFGSRPNSARLSSRSSTRPLSARLPSSQPKWKP